MHFSLLWHLVRMFLHFGTNIQTFLCLLSSNNFREKNDLFNSFSFQGQGKIKIKYRLYLLNLYFFLLINLQSIFHLGFYTSSVACTSVAALQKGQNVYTTQSSHTSVPGRLL